MRIYLIGLPGSGKTTVGKTLAQTLNYQFVDLDGEIEKNALMFIDDIIEKLGIKTFRELETEALKQITGNDVVVACGGGIVETRANKEHMDGIIIYLDVDNKTIEKRLANDYQRPLLKDNTVEELYQKRFLLYQHFSDVNISNNGEIKETINDILKLLG